MSFLHLRAILWMRWRMLVNLVKRRGKLGNTWFTLLAVVLGLIACASLFFSFALGMELLDEAAPVGILLAWSGLAAALMFFWSIGVVTELQRSDAITIHSLLHLPASMLGAHLYNYFASFVSVSLLVVLPAMIGLASASVIVLGAKMLLLFPLIVGFVGVLTALTYQLRGWLGTMVHDKRKQKNIIVLLTISFALFAQVPNLLQIAFDEEDEDKFPTLELVEKSGVLAPPTVEGETPDVVEEQTEPEESANDEAPAEDLVASADPIGEDGDGDSTSDGDGGAHAAYTAEIDEWKARRKERKKAKFALVDKWLTRAAIVVPIGWLPLGAKLAFQGHLLGSLLCFLGLAAIAGLSLRRSYRTTLRFVTGIDERDDGAGAPLPGAVKAATKPRGDFLVGRSLPIVDRGTSSVAVASAQSLLRSAEFKMVMLTPLLLLVFGAAALLASDGSAVTPTMRPYLSLGAICMGLFTVMQLLQNQFGLDRHGFRAFVLSPIPRRQLLQGKNLACAPFGLVLSGIGLIALQFLFPESVMHFLATWVLLGAGYLITSLYSNFISIVAPMKLKDGVMKADSAQGKVIFIQVVTLLLLPLCLCPIALPATLESVFEFFHIKSPIPIYLPTSLFVLLGAAWVYRLLIPRQAALLQENEQKILDRLTRAVF